MSPRGTPVIAWRKLPAAGASVPDVERGAVEADRGQTRHEALAQLRFVALHKIVEEEQILGVGDRAISAVAAPRETGRHATPR